ncbi:MAG: Flp pilus assembly complex ATPase component TadA [Desulfobacterales bacterium]|nr:Flp pilus assembly complex ATPase component TadA [Desulfobacterales bacterium]
MESKSTNSAGKQAYTILFVDDEKDTLASLARLFRREKYKILTADSAARAWSILKKEQVNVIVTDHRMPKVTGVELLEKTKRVYPDIIRIMLTGYADIDSVMEAVNKGAVYKFITKPWNDAELKQAIRLALMQYKLLTENKKLKKAQESQVKNIDKLSRFINQSRLGELLVAKRLISTQDMVKAKREQVTSGETMPVILTRMGVITPEKILQVLTTDFTVNKADLGSVDVTVELKSILPENICKSNMLIPIKKEGNLLVVAMSDPTDEMKVDALKFMTGLKIKPMAGLHRDILSKIEEAYSTEAAPPPPSEELSFVESGDSIVLTIEEKEADLDFNTLFSPGNATSPIEIVNALILDALARDASDVHIEPKNKFTMVRYRINGLLFDKHHLPLSCHPAVVSRIKVIAQLDIAEKRRPQDGRITVKTPDRMVDMRLSTLPTISGEKLVFRILDRNSSIKDIDELGMTDSQVKLVRYLIQKPQGCILVTGPTGSGKTTTLYSLIQKVATVHKNYTTIEDPVEYYMEMAEQVMIKEKIGLNFPVVLRTLLRQDPDTIMLGEIRDTETAEVAFHAALTGHTVLSTLHTNSCVATITRLTDMGIAPHIISSALNGIIAQRLVRKICPNCMIDDIPSRETRTMLGLKPRAGLVAKKGQGCDRCEHTGYHGRTGIYETLIINTEMELLLKQKATEAEIKALAVSSGMTSLFDSGMEKINMGITTCEEILRILGPRNLHGFACPGCGNLMPEQYNYCPYCSRQLKQRCGQCQKNLEPEWNACPDCGEKAKGRTLPPAD